MPIKEKSIFKKHSFEYESSDGDKWDIVVIEAEGRKYIQFNQVDINNSEMKPIIMDGEMLLEMADAYRKVTSQVYSQVFNPNLRAPNIQDHRGLDVSERIQAQVDQSMANQDHSTKPIQSLSPVDEFASFRTGVDIDNRGEVPDTPEEIAINPENNELKQWQKDALERKHKPNIKARGSSKTISKKIGSQELI